MRRKIIGFVNKIFGAVEDSLSSNVRVNRAENNQLNNPLITELASSENIKSEIEEANKKAVLNNNSAKWVDKFSKASSVAKTSDLYKSLYPYLCTKTKQESSFDNLSKIPDKDPADKTNRFLDKIALATLGKMGTSLLIHPLDVIRFDMQSKPALKLGFLKTAQHIYMHGGALAFFKGAQVSVLQSGVKQFFYRTQIMNYIVNNNLNPLLAGAISATSDSLVNGILNRVKISHITSNNNSIKENIKAHFLDKGKFSARASWRNLSAGANIYWTMQFCGWSYFYSLDDKIKEASKGNNFHKMFLLNLASTSYEVVTTPFSVALTLSQKNDNPLKLSLKGSMQYIWKNYGLVNGLYCGIVPRVLASAIKINFTSWAKSVLENKTNENKITR